jgi:hypothetical protein
VEHVGLFYVHLEYIKAVWYILWPHDKMLVIWLIFPRFGVLYQTKYGNPATLYPHGIRTREPKAPISSVAGGDDTTRPSRQMLNSP